MTISFASFEVPATREWKYDPAMGRRALIPHLSSLRAKLIREFKHDNDRHRAVHWDLEVLPYSLAGTYNALLRFVKLQGGARRSEATARYSDIP